MRVGTVVGLAAVVSGCVYLNLVYNARHLYDEAERERWAGREVQARSLYDSVVAKAARTYRTEPEGEWADDALYLLGRAYLRRGEPTEAAAALERTLEITRDPAIRAGALLHLGFAVTTTGDRGRGLAYLNDALRVLEDDALRAEGHFWRGRMLLESDRPAPGWWDLDRAAEADSKYRVAAGLEHLRWGVAHGDSARVREGVSRLLALPEARVREDTLLVLVDRSVDLWGPRTGARLLAGAHRAVWPQAARDRLTLSRARFRLRSGDVDTAEADAAAVADGVGSEATEARLFLAGLRLADAERMEDLADVRATLLPAVGDARVLELLEAVRIVEILGIGPVAKNSPESLFAAAELARDEMDAPVLARNLFLRYAETGAPWRGKALLAAAQLTAAPAERAPILRRLAQMRGDPYVGAFNAGIASSSAVTEMDARLEDTIAEVLSEAASRARGLDVLARERSDTIR